MSFLETMDVKTCEVRFYTSDINVCDSSYEILAFHCRLFSVKVMRCSIILLLKGNFSNRNITLYNLT